MKDLEMNKILAAVFLAGLIALFSGRVADILYHPEHDEPRGFKVEIASAAGDADAAPKKEVPLDIPALMAKADAAHGKVLTKKCASCHSFEKGGKNLVGPLLYGVFGRPKGTHEGYSYSDGMKAKGGNWDEDSLFHFLHKPRDFVKGTKMGFAGFKKNEDIADVVAYLKTLK